ncbi:MAG: matrixin family metalloprotease [Cyanobacteriota bacterium]
MAAARRPAPLAAGLLAPATPAPADPAHAAPAPSEPAPDYRDRLSSTEAGPPRMPLWCVWVQPTPSGREPTPWEQRWQRAVEASLARWRRQLPIERVADPEAAQVRLRRQRPPLRLESDGRRRASHGRALLQLQEVERQGVWRLEPLVEVLISPDQREAAIQATALHELGHAFGLWGHSDQPGDAMAAVPGSVPVLELSPRDLASLRWLYGQPSRFGQPLRPPAASEPKRPGPAGNQEAAR